MATITTTATLIEQYNAFTGLSALERSQSGIARAELVYYNLNDNWAAPGAGNLRAYDTGVIDLPKDFGYVLTDAFVKVDSAASMELEMVGPLQIRVGGSLGPQINTYLRAAPGMQDTSGNTAIGDITATNFNTTFAGADNQIIYVLEQKPTALIYPFASQAYTTAPNPASQWRWQLAEHTQATTNDYDVSCYFRFLQYDIDQSFNYVIQSPQLTR